MGRFKTWQGIEERLPGSRIRSRTRRDIEPTKGGGYQMVSNIRRFKGMNAPEPVCPAPVISS
jgi:hypothetical protein